MRTRVSKNLYGQTLLLRGRVVCSACDSCCAHSVQGGQTSAHCYTSHTMDQPLMVCLSQSYGEQHGASLSSADRLPKPFVLKGAGLLPTKSISLSLNFKALIYHWNSRVTQEPRPQTAQLKEFWAIINLLGVQTLPASFWDGITLWECGSHISWTLEFFSYQLITFSLNVFSTSPFSRLQRDP